MKISSKIKGKRSQHLQIAKPFVNIKQNISNSTEEKVQLSFLLLFFVFWMEKDKKEHLIFAYLGLLLMMMTLLCLNGWIFCVSHCHVFSVSFWIWIRFISNCQFVLFTENGNEKRGQKTPLFFFCPALQR